MANLLYLVHRLPYPPNKGDKVRSYHLLKHLAAQHQVFLGTFVDDPQDEVHVPTVRDLCAELHVPRLRPRQAKLRSAWALLGEQALTLRYYRDAGMNAWVDQLASRHAIDAVVVFSSAMAQYAQRLPQIPMLVDFVDVDSAKWSQYASQHRWPMSWLYRREGESLLAYERSVALQARRSFFVTDKESALFTQLAPECAGRVDTISNGVDADFFSPDASRPSPFAATQELPIVFTGAMDYWPNVDAVKWFAENVFPLVRKECPEARFYIVGSKPAEAVRALANEAVIVTGRVDDVRPYLQHAAAAVAPMRIARGIQNKVLEGMAMAKPVIVSPQGLEGIDASPGTEVLLAESADEFADLVLQVCAGAYPAMGQAARERVQADFVWEHNLPLVHGLLQTDSITLQERH